MASGNRIEGRVAAVVDNQELVINRGSDHGVQVGMRFAVLQPDALPVTDPETGEQIGSVPLVKAVVKVVRIDGPRLATARTFRTVPGTAPIFAAVMGGHPDRQETFAYQKSALLGEVPEEAYAIDRGDYVVETTGEEYS